MKNGRSAVARRFGVFAPVSLMLILTAVANGFPLSRRIWILGKRPLLVDGTIRGILGTDMLTISLLLFSTIPPTGTMPFSSLTLF